MSDTVIKVEGVSKKYCRTLKHTMLYGVTDISRQFLGVSQHTENLREGEFWSVDDVSFELKRGECLGLIGPNGSGKSTLLKMLNGIFMPDRGMIEVNGRVGALIEVGAGFHPLLTGRENIYINGAILGMSKQEIDKKLDSILDFAGIGDFIDSPVKYYSSGMYVRLGFAVAAHLKPEILLIDEVLAVGDVAFRLKCFNHIKKLINDGVAIIFVSHNISEIVRVCNSGIFINEGKSAYKNYIHEAIHQYQKLSYVKAKSMIISKNTPFKIINVQTFDTAGNKKTDFLSGDDIIIQISYESNIISDNSIFLIKLVSQELGPFSSFTNLVSNKYIPLEIGKGNIYVQIINIPLVSGSYSIEVHVYDKDKSTFWDQLIPACTFDITAPKSDVWMEFHSVRIDHKWILDQKEAFNL